MAVTPQLDEGLYRRFAELTPDPFVAHVGGQVVWVNQAGVLLMRGASAGDLLGRQVLDLVAPTSRAKVQARIQRMIATGAPEPMEDEELLRLDGTTLLAEVSAAPVGQGVILGVIRDITARRSAERQLELSERRYRELLEQLPVGVWEEDFSEVKRFVDGLRAKGVADVPAHLLAHPEDVAACARLARVTAVNAEACRLAGASGPAELLANLARVLPPESLPDFGRVVAALARGETSVRTDGWNGTLDGGRRWVSMRAVVTEGHQDDWSHLVVTTADITDRLRAREERDALNERLRQSEKLEAVGRLAGGVAHDFNNLLAGVLGHVELALLELAPGSPAALELEPVRAAALRARDLVRQILTFGKKDRPRPGPLDLTRVVGEALGLARAGVQAPVALEAALQPTGTVLADEGQVHQLVLNLCANARDAGARRIEVSLEPLVPGPEVPELQGTPCARLRVKDDGEGMDEGVRAHLFEPYLTTRATSGGHGLGLAVVHGIVTAAGGAVKVASARGQGSTFDVWLPLGGGPEAPAPRPPLPAGGSERVLLVDDEPLVRSAHRRVLASLGYRVTVASDGEEALALLRAGPEAFDLVMTDQAMPRLTGFELARRWLQERPGARVLLVTGFTEELDEAAATSAGLKGLLLKPATRAALAAAVRAALDG